MSDDDSTPDLSDAEGIACSLTEAEAERRRERVTDELFPHLEAVAKRDDGVRFTLADTDEAVERAMEFVRLEHRCCSFATFDLRVTPRGESNRLDVTGEGAEAMFDQGLKPLLDEYDRELIET